MVPFFEKGWKKMFLYDSKSTMMVMGFLMTWNLYIIFQMFFTFGNFSFIPLIFFNFFIFGKRNTFWCSFFKYENVFKKHCKPCAILCLLDFQIFLKIQNENVPGLCINFCTYTQILCLFKLSLSEVVLPSPLCFKANG